MAAVTTADRVTFEDLSAADKVLDQRGTPFWEAIRNGPALKNHLLYTQAVDTTGKRIKQGAPERQDVKGFEGDKGTELGARGEKFRRYPSISTEAEEENNSASQTMKDYNAQVRQKTIEERRDIDFVILGDQESQTDDGVNGYFLRAAGRWINDGSTGATTSQGGDSPTSYTSGTADLAFNDTMTAIPPTMRTPAAQIYADTLANLTESSFTDMMQSAWGRSGAMMEFTLWCAAGLKRHISDNFGKYQANKPGFTPIVQTSTADIDKRRLVAKGIDVFEGDFGTFTVELEPWMPTNERGYGMDMGQVRRRILYLLRHTEFENKGGGRRGLIESILSVWFGDPRRHIKICPATEVAATVNFDS